jgi:hypothetical protein
MNFPRLFGAVTENSTGVVEPGFVAAPAVLVPFVRLGRGSAGLLLLLLIRTATAEPKFEIAFGTFDALGGCQTARNPVTNSTVFGLQSSAIPVTETGTTEHIGAVHDDPGDDIFGHGAGWASHGDLFLSTQITGPTPGPSNPDPGCAHISGKSRFEVTDVVFTSRSGKPGRVPQVTFNYNVLKLEVEEMSDEGNQTWQISGGLTSRSVVNCGGCDLVPGNDREFEDDLFPDPLNKPPATMHDVPLGSQFAFFMQLDTTIQVYENAPAAPPVQAQAHLTVDCRERVFNFSSDDFTADSESAGIENNYFIFSTPTIDSITPDEGAERSVVTISGSGLESVTKVYFRRLDPTNSPWVMATSFQRVSAEHLRATVPNMGRIFGEGVPPSPWLQIKVEAPCAKVAFSPRTFFNYHEKPVLTISPPKTTAEGSNHEFIVRVSPLPLEDDEEEPLSVHVATFTGRKSVCKFPSSPPLWLGCRWITTTAISGNLCLPFFGKGPDFMSYSATLSDFTPDADSADGVARVNVWVCDDTRVEQDEIFLVQMSQPTGAEFSWRSGRDFATGIIKNDDTSSPGWPP